MIYTLLRVSAEEEKWGRKASPSQDEILMSHISVFRDFFSLLLSIFSTSYSKQALSTREKPHLWPAYPQWRVCHRPSFSCLYPEMFNSLCKRGNGLRWMEAALSLTLGSEAPPGAKLRGLWPTRRGRNRNLPSLALYLGYEVKDLLNLTGNSLLPYLILLFSLPTLFSQTTQNNSVLVPKTIKDNQSPFLANILFSKNSDMFKGAQHVLLGSYSSTKLEQNYLDVILSLTPSIPTYPSSQVLSLLLPILICQVWWFFSTASEYCYRKGVNAVP